MNNVRLLHVLLCILWSLFRLLVQLRLLLFLADILHGNISHKRIYLHYGIYKLNQSAELQTLYVNVLCLFIEEDLCVECKREVLDKICNGK